jgi:hypothetical protein
MKSESIHFQLHWLMHANLASFENKYVAHQEMEYLLWFIELKEFFQYKFFLIQRLNVPL